MARRTGATGAAGAIGAPGAVRRPGAMGATSAPGPVRGTGAIGAAAAVRTGRVALAGRRKRTNAAPQLAHQANPSHPSDLDRVIHDRTRLSIMSALAVNETLSFTELKALTETTDGNLSVHARKLEDAGYVHCDKSFFGRMPRTDFRLTAAGRRALEKYLDHMEALIRVMRKK